MLLSVAKTLGVCIEEFGVSFLRSSESSILRASHLFSPKKFFLDTAPIKHLLQPQNSGNRNYCSPQSCFESYTYIYNGTVNVSLLVWYEDTTLCHIQLDLLT